MKAVGYQKSLPIDNANSLIDIELSVPQPSERDLLVKVNAISVNPVDTKIRTRNQPDEGQHKVLGWDAVGEVVAVGSLVEHYKVGDAVWYAGDINRPGANSEFHLVDERVAGKKPTSLSDAQAAALPLTAITAWELLFERFKFTPTPNTTTDDSVRLLIIGAAGGVGSILTQLAKKLTNATVIGTASRVESQNWLAELGADHTIDHTKAFAPQLEALGIDNVTHVISLNQTQDHFDQCMEILAPQGDFALIDDPSEPLDVMKLKAKSLSLHFELMFTRTLFQTEDMDQQRQLLNAVSTLIDDGEIITTLGQHFGIINAENLRRAHALLESGKSIGKVVLEGFE
ncbi:zinc-binding alcohol dehydrogenase family protein [Vibrio sp. ZSDE26]|uniref:Zinc-type alcohol dehydrogenase-like protein n=1 Tax=Vibrio amylolyticus TaxID=2847292 RepID=A0A9X1XLA5_9VIBR|nr:zinc-binding alcohol dehydrogenase family protein [Vibrio amylolyticus]MCK6264899.1 zinc-binding alcohol dehydrogenase family protein [Vibrio amylolyticus]